MVLCFVISLNREDLHLGLNLEEESTALFLFSESLKYVKTFDIEGYRGCSFLFDL